jgi:hypothetical protein
VLPPKVACGAQRPGVNVAPAIAPDGSTIFTVSRAHFSGRDSFLVAVTPDLKPKWAASLRDRLADGCGVLIPSDGDATNQPTHCRPGSTLGVERITNEKPAGQVSDSSSSSPVALPDGGVIYGTYTGYNASRGHLMKFAADGSFAGAYDFGWDLTPAIYVHGNSYSIVLKDNHYGQDPNGVDLGPYFITQLSADLKPEWNYRNTNTMSCSSDVDGGVQCVSDHPNGFEWCINAPAVDKSGTVYATGEDGVLYAIGQNGVALGRLFLSESLGSTYTPVSIDHTGRIYTQNNSTLLVVGGP